MYIDEIKRTRIDETNNFTMQPADAEFNTKTALTIYDEFK